MIRVSDLPLANPRAFAPASAKPADGAGAANWFDGEPLRADTRISADPNAASRGLSVAQHADRVLGFLCDRQDDRL